MSRAFVKEDGPDNAPLPDLPISPHPNLVTPRGLAQLRDRLAEAQALLQRLRARPDRLDRLPEAAAERDIRYLEARLRSAIPVDPASAPPGEVAFGSRVTVAGEDGTTRVLSIVGEDEADPRAGSISYVSPVARLLLGKEVGDVVSMGEQELEIVAVG